MSSLALAVRTAAGAPIALEPACWLYVWSGVFGLARDLRFALDEIEEIKPDGLILHGSPEEIRRDIDTAFPLAVRAMGSASRVAVGIGADGTVDDWRAARASEDDVIAPLVRACSLSHRLGCRFFVPNAEAGWADSPQDYRTPAEIEELATRAARAMKAAAPDAIFAVSSYDQPTYHADVVPMLRAWTREFPLYTGQTYTAVPGVPSRAALPSRFAAWLRSQGIAERKGWITADAVEREIAQDCDRFPTIQGHKVEPAAGCKAVAETPHIAVWAAPSIKDEGVNEGGRLDLQGVSWLRAGMALRRAGYVGPGAVERFQRDRGLFPDGIPGAKTFAALRLPFVSY